MFKIPEGRLLPAHLGGFHYVGPASSIYFAMTFRQLVSKTDLVSMAKSDGNLFGRMIKAAEFTSFNVSKALEARIVGHPATNAANDEEPSPVMDFTEPAPSTVISDGATPRSILRNGRWKQILPSRAVSDRLVQAFFDRVHPNYTLFHKGHFFISYEDIWSPHPEVISMVDPGWICALMMVLVLGALALETEGFADAGAIQQQYLTIVLRDGLSRLSLMASVSNVQALMLLALYQHNSGERNGAWMLVGQAARMAVALGMHRDEDTASFGPVERNSRRMIWWVLYIFEQNLSFVLGRPSSTDLFDRTAKLPDESIILNSDLPPEHFANAARLAELSVRVKRFTASLSVNYEQPDFLLQNIKAADQLKSDMEAWRNCLPQHLLPTAYFETGRYRRAVLLLHIHYDYVRSILGRPFLLCRVNYEIDNPQVSHPKSAQSIVQYADIAIRAARSSIDNLHALGSHRLLEGQVWLDLFYVHHATFMLGLPYLSQSEDTNPQYQTHRRAVSGMLALCQKMYIAPTYRILLNVAMQFAYIVGMGPEAPDDTLLPANLMIPTLDDGMAPAPLDPGLPLTTTPVVAWDQIFGPLPSRQSSPRGVFADLYNYGLDTEPGTEGTWDFFNLAALTGAEPAIDLSGSSAQYGNG